MKIITRYLAREVYSAMFVVILILLAIFLSNQFVHYMHSAAVGNLTGKGIRMLLLLQLPILAAVLLPASLFFSILLAYGRLYADSEMTVLLACGVSPMRLLTTTLGFSSIIVVFIAFLSLWINPEFYKYSDRIFSEFSSISSLEMVKPNSFTPIAKDKWIFYIDDNSTGKKQFSHVFVAEQLDANGHTNNDNLHIIMAKDVYQKIDKKTGDLYIVLTDGYRYVGIPGKKDYEMMKYDEYAVRVQQENGHLKHDASSTSTIKLLHDCNNEFSAAELQWRISLPLSAFILSILGVPLSKIRPRYGRYAKLVPAILLYITYANFLFLARTWIKNGLLKPVVGMWWIHTIMITVALFLICQQLGWQEIFSNRRKSNL